MGVRVNRNIDWVTDDDGTVVGYEKSGRRFIGNMILFDQNNQPYLRNPDGQNIGLGGGSFNGRFREAAIVRELRSLLPTFGSGAPDNTRSRSHAGTTYYIDPLLGDDGRNGLTPANARQSIPQYLANGQHDSKVLIAAGSVINMPNRWSVLPVNNRCTISVYDGNPASSRYGQEITDQPNPFVRALLGGWISEEEIAAKYFTIATDWTGVGLGASSLTSGGAFNTSSCPDVLIRGFVVQGTPNGVVINNPTGNNVRLEDFYIRNAATDPDTNTSRFGGVGIRVIGPAGGSPTVSMARFFAEGVGEDVMHAINTSAVTGSVTCSDFAIYHTPTQQKYNAQHADVFQFAGRPGPVQFRRGVIYHYLPEAPLLDTGAGSTAVGGIFVSTGVTGDQTGTGGLFEDCVMVSNVQLALVERQPGFRFRRCIGVMSNDNPNESLGITASAMLVNAFTGTILEDDCIWAVNRPSSQLTSIRAQIDGGAPNTQTNVIDVPNYAIS